MVLPLGNTRTERLERRIDKFISQKRNILRKDISNSFYRFIVRIICLKWLSFGSIGMAGQLIERQPKSGKNLRTIFIERFQPPNSINKQRSALIKQKPHLRHPLHMLLTANQFEVSLELRTRRHPQKIH